jgi:hypothetical protein
VGYSLELPCKKCRELTPHKVKEGRSEPLTLADHSYIPYKRNRFCDQCAEDVGSRDDIDSVVTFEFLGTELDEIIRMLNKSHRAIDELKKATRELKSLREFKKAVLSAVRSLENE